MVQTALNCFLYFIFQQYQTDNEKNWKAKDAAIFLVTSLACKKQTAKVNMCQLNLPYCECPYYLLISLRYTFLPSKMDLLHKFSL